ncbi:S8 family serine peptidase [Mesobacillus selenatarsenatis]|uniref:S8 family serine peptidase n=1 Tax=Mesobacillus selenatarsenatis TaxID=388741 RepID=A0A846TCP7_9BACI|nr:S8 family serine peptidase [Mesobacillus selenatarsenatis]NKE06828.1 S8 family serine peptidase [Mesobacillus selenatarsenatis]
MKRKNTGRKIASSVLASALVLSSFSFPLTSASAAENAYSSKIKQIEQYKAKQLKQLDGKYKKTKASLKAEDKVRVIVEVEGETPVEYATKQGKLYKELSEDTKSSIDSKLKSAQKSVKDKIKSKNIRMDHKKSFSTAFNGFSGEVTYKDIAKIEGIAGVKNVYLANEYNRPEEAPDMKTSHNYIQSQATWADAGLKGEGMIVSVIDTGVDPSHKDFVLTDKAQAELSKEETETLVTEEGLKGKYFSDKVPYGYNYYDENQTILDLGPEASMHGMHVAGTVAANGDEATGGIKGVAPEAQVLGMKVFSNDPNYPSTWSDVYLAAIDDSIKLGADVLNMSLGSTASFYEEKSAENLAITRAVDNGIVAAVSAGNSGHIGYGWDNPYAQNPDIGLVGAPGLNTNTIQVAASGNDAYLYQHTFTVQGNESFSAVGYGIDDWVKLSEENGPLEMVAVPGVGADADYAGVDVKGKVAVVSRGSLSFYDKTVNAAEAGAIGIIVYNNGGSTFFNNQGGWDVPFMLIQTGEGEALKQAIAAGNNVLNVSQTKKQEDVEMGRMTEFTSWGTTPSLDFKPEITAPGGKIYSTLQDDKYGVKSGTSMAAPHVAGGSALVQQYLQSDERFSELTAGERTKLAKVLLMNTADAIDDLYGQPFSPRRQGAGMMQTFAAVNTPAVVVDSATGEAKVGLKDFTSKQFEMTLTASNLTDEEVTYSVDTSVLTDYFYQVNGDEDYNALIAADMPGAVVDAPETVTVPAGESVEFTVSVDLTDAKIPGEDKDGNEMTYDLKEDIFVEGFVTLTDVNGAEDGQLLPQLNVPYMGFYGEWDRPEILDGFTSLGESRYYDLKYLFKSPSEMLFGADGNFSYQVPEKDFFAVSPNGDGYFDDVYPLPAFMRNAAEVQYNVLDENGKFLRRVLMEKDVRKNFYNGGTGSPYSFNPARAWNGKVKSDTVKDGLYYYEIKSVIDYEGAEWQSKKIPVYIDTTAPEVKAAYDAETSTVSWEAKEDGTGVEFYAIFVDGKLVDQVAGNVTNYQLTDVPEKALVEVAAVDYGFNIGFDIAAVGDTDMPLIYLDDASPEPYGAYNTLEVPVKGYVEDDYVIEKITVNGKDVEFTFNEEKSRYDFSTTTSFEKDGKYDVIVTALDYSGKEFSINRRVFVDTTAPEIVVDAPAKVGKATEEVTLKLNLKDNFNYLSLYVDNNHEFVKEFDSPVEIVNAADEMVEVTVPVAMGENTIELKLTDLGGNETVKEVKVERAELKKGWKKEDNKWFYYNEDVKQTGWLKDGTKWYYLNKDGVMQTGWVQDAGKWYFLEKSGVMKTGWVKDGSKWYFLAKSGAMQTGWVQDGGRWYFLEKSGAMKTGWLLDGGEWYYLNTSGSMQTGWKLVGSKWYYFYKSGKMAKDTKIGAYKLGKDGSWIK